MSAKRSMAGRRASLRRRLDDREARRDRDQRTPDQRLSATTVCIGMPPSFMVFAMAFGGHVTQF